MSKRSGGGHVTARGGTGRPGRHGGFEGGRYRRHHEGHHRGGYSGDLVIGLGGPYHSGYYGPTPYWGYRGFAWLWIVAIIIVIIIIVIIFISVAIAIRNAAIAAATTG